MLKGLVDAYRYLQDEAYLELALQNAAFLEKNMIQESGALFHNHKNGKSTINGYLEDYAALIEAYIGLYEVGADEKWLSLAKKLTDYCLDHFLDATSGLFFFTSKNDDFIIRRTLETTDNVIASSNSIMAKNLFKLSGIYLDQTYYQRSLGMLKSMQEKLLDNAQNHANWLQLNLCLTHSFYEVAIVGEGFAEKRAALQSQYLPYCIFAGAEKASSLPILKDRFIQNQTPIYICEQGSCKLPIGAIDEALTLLRN